MRRSRHTERGAALLLAMIVLTLVATVAAAMVWQQSASIQVEAAERARTQAYWMLDSGIDFGRYVVRRFSSTKPKDGAPWDNDLQEIRLSSLLAVDRDNNADAQLEAFISGRIDDAQARYNLRNLVDASGKVVPEERKVLEQLCQQAGAGAYVGAIVAALEANAGTPVNGTQPGSNVALAHPLTRIEHLRWLGIDEATLSQLRELIDILPKTGTKVNLNTASGPVIQAVTGLDAGNAARLVRAGGPPSSRFNTLAEANALLGLAGDKELNANRVDVSSQFFYVRATVRYEDRALAANALVELEGQGNAAPVHLRRLERGPVGLSSGS